jgi:hypothetical protein
VTGIALGTGLGVTFLLQLFCYYVGMPPGTSTVVSCVIGCGAYVVTRLRQPPEYDADRSP